MTKKHFKNGKWICGVIFACFLTSCGTDSNLNQMIWSSQDEQAFDSLFREARMEYDQGNFDKALSLAEKLQNKSPTNEKVALLVGYIYLSKAQADPFQIAKNLTTLQSTTSSSSGGASSNLQNLSSLISLTSADFAKMATGGTTSSVGSAVDQSFAIILPKKPGSISDASSPRGSINTLLFINKAIQVICPFVDVSGNVRNAEDSRHSCTPTTETRYSSAKAHFLWSISHLIEALTFNSVLMYSGPSLQLTDPDMKLNTSSESANILNWVNALENKSFEGTQGISTYVTEVQQMKSTITSVFDTSADSMLTATLIAFESVSNGFEAIQGIPKDLIKSITNSMQSLRDAATKIANTSGGDPNALGSKTKAMKGQLNEQVAKNLKNNINKISQANADIPAAQKTELCSSYEVIAEGVPVETVPKPDICSE